MTPEEAYEMTERKWRTIAGGNLDVDPGSMKSCGLCLFAGEKAGDLSRSEWCHMLRCPGSAVFGKPCYHLDWLQDCLNEYGPDHPETVNSLDYMHLARIVLDKLISHKEQLIAEMERIREEK